MVECHCSNSLSHQPNSISSPSFIIKKKKEKRKKQIPFPFIFFSHFFTLFKREWAPHHHSHLPATTPSTQQSNRIKHANNKVTKLQQLTLSKIWRENFETSQKAHVIEGNPPKKTLTLLIFKTLPYPLYTASHSLANFRAL